MLVFIPEMDPGVNWANYQIDSLNKKLGSYLIGPENPFVIGMEYAVTRGISLFADSKKAKRMRREKGGRHVRQPGEKRSSQ